MGRVSYYEAAHFLKKDPEKNTCMDSESISNFFMQRQKLIRARRARRAKIVMMFQSIKRLFD